MRGGSGLPELESMQPAGENLGKTAFRNDQFYSLAGSLDKFDAAKHAMNRDSSVVMGGGIPASHNRAFG